jgi:hypothetical protein
MATHEDLDWWRRKFSEEVISMDVIRPPSPCANRIYMDMSTSWGISLWINDRWLAWKLKPGWQEEGKNIGWAEMVAVELALQTLVALGHRDQHFVIFSDNQGVVGSLRAGISRGTAQHAILQKIVGLMQDHKIWLTTEWVSTHDNLADGLSRGALGTGRKAISHRPRIPKHLVEFLTSVP